MKRDAYREYLRKLSDDDLRRESRERILAYRELPRYTTARADATDVAALCWAECQDRGRDEIYREALAGVKAEEAERRRINDLPSAGPERSAESQEPEAGRPGS